jgi:hypothetical protein
MLGKGKRATGVGSGVQSQSDRNPIFKQAATQIVYLAEMPVQVAMKVN